MKKKSWPVLFLFIIAIEAVGFLSAVLSGVLSGDIKAAYAAFELPPLSPPDWLFGVMWSILYAFIAIAAYLIFTSTDERKAHALYWFWVQLALNFSWSIIFFRWDLYWAAFIIILLMIVLTILIINQFYKIDKTASLLMIPYLLWLIFAAYLNLGIALLN